MAAKALRTRLCRHRQRPSAAPQVWSKTISPPSGHGSGLAVALGSNVRSHHRTWPRWLAAAHDRNRVNRHRRAADAECELRGHDRRRNGVHRVGNARRPRGVRQPGQRACGHRGAGRSERTGRSPDRRRLASAKGRAPNARDDAGAGHAVAPPAPLREGSHAFVRRRVPMAARGETLVVAKASTCRPGISPCAWRCCSRVSRQHPHALEHSGSTCCERSFRHHLPRLGKLFQPVLVRSTTSRGCLAAAHILQRTVRLPVECMSGIRFALPPAA